VSATQTVTAPPTMVGPPPLRRPRVGSRLSGGHLLMLVAALLAMLLNFSLLRASDTRVRVAVAATPLRAGAAVDPSSFSFVEVDVGDELLPTLLDPERARSVHGWVAAHDLARGELVGTADLRRPSAPAQQRAMSIPIDPSHAVGGELQPGDRVDVIEVASEGAAYILDAAEVIAVSGRATSGLGSLEGFSVTVAVDEAEALRIAAAIRAEAVEIIRSTGAVGMGATPTSGGTAATPSGRAS
jgi:Flp pilus assembly protein CpaB